MIIAKWCREGRWENGKLLGACGVIYDPEQIAVETASRIDQERARQAWEEWAARIPTFSQLESLRKL